MKRKDFSTLSIQTQYEKNTYFEHENFIAGTPPFLRGIHSTMFIQSSIKTQLLVNFSSPNKCNTFIKEQILEGYNDVILHFNTTANNENKGILAKSIDEMRLLLLEIPLEKISITISANESILSILKLFLTTINELKIDAKKICLSATTINSKVTYSPKLLENIFAFVNSNFPLFNSLCISGYKLVKESNFETEFAFFLAQIFEYFNFCVSNGMSIDGFASKFSFNNKISDDTIFEISKMRAARLLWAKMIQQFNPKNLKSLALQINSNSTFSTNLEVLSTIMGGSQSVISSRPISLVLNEETFITKTVDPWGGSTIIEKNTENIFNKTWNIYDEIQKKGGFSKNMS